MNVQVGLARATDAEILSHIALSAKAYWDYPKRWMEIWKSQLTFTPEYFEENESWAAETDNNLIAFYTLLDQNGNAWIENLWVVPEYIGKGIGRQLFSHAVDLARQRGYTTLQLKADPNAVMFYEKMGMCIIGERVSKVDGQRRILPVMEMSL